MDDAVVLGEVAVLDQEPGREAAHGQVFGGADFDRFEAFHAAALAENDISELGCPVVAQPFDLVVDLAEERLAKLISAS